MQFKSSFTLLILIISGVLPCRGQEIFTANFDAINNRMWVGRDFWSVPMEDWRVEGGRLECTGNRQDMRVNLLTHTLSGTGTVELSIRMGLLDSGEQKGSAGFRIGIDDETDHDVKSLVYFGTGVNAGIHTDGYLFIEDAQLALPPNFDLSSFTLHVSARSEGQGSTVKLTAVDRDGNERILNRSGNESLYGLVALVNSFRGKQDQNSGVHFWFDDLSLSGSMVEKHEENGFGPILWSMYTLSRGTVKMTAQLPPISVADEQYASLQVKRGNEWVTVGREKIDADARTAIFRVDGWDATQAWPYRVVYNESYTDGTTQTHYYEGTIRQDPQDKPLVVGGLTCQHSVGFPYGPLVKHLTARNPDLLYFSGDQIYEPNGGYGIIRFPAERAIENYLGKWYMFGWAFGDLMRDRPTIVIPDDHDVFQGNIWGAGGKPISEEEWQRAGDSRAGYVQPARMVNVVHLTQTGHLPDPYDPQPIEQSIRVHYTDFVYGGVSFAIVNDRMFKSGPEEVSFWEGRKDHLKIEDVDPARLDKPGLTLLGDRQLAFLRHWMRDWEGARMKVLLSETVFSNVATHHGGDKMYLRADLDSGGWPKSGRDKIIDILRRAFVFHISGDQHLPSLVQYGLNGYRDGSWAFCTPAISVGYERRFLPDQLGIPVKDRPEHGLPNTGAYEDGFGNKFFVYAVGNPESETRDPNRYKQAQNRASGYGLIRFDKKERTITASAYPFLTDPGEDIQFPGWPLTIHQFENDGREAVAWLPEINTNVEDPVVEVTRDGSDELVSIVRIQGKVYRPGVFEQGAYTVRISHPESGKSQTITGIQATGKEDAKVLQVNL